MRFVHHIIFIFAAFLVPLVPSYVLYRNLSSRTIVEGPFKGLTIRLTGAFGGYFLLVLLAFSLAWSALRPAKPTHEVWRVAGTVEAQAIDPETGTRTNDVAGVNIGVTPPNFQIGTEGDFGMKITVAPGLVEGQRTLPTLMFTRPGYTAVVLPLDGLDMDIDEETRTMTLRQQVVLQKLSETTEGPRSPRP